MQKFNIMCVCMRPSLNQHYPCIPDVCHSRGPPNGKRLSDADSDAGTALTNEPTAWCWRHSLARIDHIRSTLNLWESRRYFGVSSALDNICIKIEERQDIFMHWAWISIMATAVLAPTWHWGICGHNDTLNIRTHHGHCWQMNDYERLLIINVEIYERSE